MHDAPASTYIQVVEKPSQNFLNTFLASIIKFPPEGNKGDLSYQQLTCSLEDMTCIEEIITTVGEYGKGSLFLKQSHLKQLETQIIHVHPLKFLATIFKSPSLRLCMNQIADDYFKWDHFMKGLSPRLTIEADKGKLEKHLLDFSADIGIASDHIRIYFQNRDWKSLVHALMSFYD
jgi:hypothetical protein